MKRVLLTSLASLLVLSTAPKLSADERGDFDKYGGYRAIKGRKTGYFHLEKIGKQWIFITPDGHGLYPLTVAAIYFNHRGLTNEGKNYTQIVEQKYRREGDKDNIAARERWGDKVRKRLREWGFTAIGPYSYAPAIPDLGADAVYYQGKAAPGVPDEPMAYITTQANMEAPIRSGQVKNLWSSLWDRKIGQAFFADVFDPKFAKAIEEYARREMPAEMKKWILFAFIEQTDWMRGVSPGHPHLGWGAAAANFEMAEGVIDFAGRKKKYEDTKLYTKYALRDFLKSKYKKIEKLNEAWGTKYTSWDSDGGWGKGTGLLDEDGRNLGGGKLNDPRKKGFPALREDLDIFAAKIMRQFFRTAYQTRKKFAPEILLSTNNFGTPHNYVIEGLVSEDGKEAYADVICCGNVKKAPQWYAKLKRPFFPVSIFAMAVNDSPMGYRGTVTKVEYDEVLKNGTRVLTDDPNKHADKEVDQYKSRVIVTASGVNFWWAKHPQLKIPYRTMTQFSSILECRTPAGSFKKVRWASRPWKSMDWLAPNKFAVHQQIPFGYFALKRTLKPGDTLWRVESSFPNAETQEQRAKLYRDQALEVANARAADGDYIFCGFNYWAWWDTSWLGITWDLAFNVGMVTFNDNAYDGTEAVWGKGTDEDGYPIGGETRPPHISAEKKGFGDFLTGVTKTNKEIIKAVSRRASK